MSPTTFILLYLAFQSVNGGRIWWR